MTPRSALAWCLRRLRGRPDSEHEMSYNRLIFAAIVLAALCVRWRDETLHAALAGVVVYVVLSVAIVGHILIHPGVSHGRRLLALVLDCACLSWELHLGSEAVSIFVLLYLWIILGNGFRFGIVWLALAVPVASLSFAVMAMTTPFWARQPHLSDGLLVGFIILPAYAGTLIQKLSAATRLAEQASAAKSLFLASVSHELRTPLTAIVGMTGLLRASRLDHEQRDMVETVDVATRSLQSLINGLLDMSRIESGRMPTQTDDFDLLTLLADIRRLVETQLEEKGLRLDIHVTPRTPLRLLASRQHLHEILLNLVGNAVKFTEAGGVVIAVDGIAVAGEASGYSMGFEVSDTGIGIAPQDQARIFENFTQANSSIINRFGGTGLGLAITRRLVELLGGSIEVASALGAGSTFRFHIKAQAAPTAMDDAWPAGRGIGIIAQDHVVAERIIAGLELAGVDAYAHCTPPEINGEAGQILLVHKRDWKETEPVLARLAQRPAVIMVNEAAEPTLPDVATRKRCMAIVGDPQATADLRRALTVAIRLGAPPPPAAPRTELTARPLPPPVPAARPAQAVVRRRILLVDDNRTNQRVFRRILESAGHIVLTAEDGEQALDQLEREASRLDLVLMDFNMPELDGIEATKLFRMMPGPSGRTPGDDQPEDRLPIVGLTADATAETTPTWREAGMDGCLIKPVEPALLLATVDRLARTTSAATLMSPGPVTPLQAHPRFRTAPVPALDETILANLRQLGDASFMDELMADFLADARILVDDLVAAARRGDTREFRNQAHALRSSAANLGATALGDLCTPWNDLRGTELQSRAGEFADRAQAELFRTGEAIAALESVRRARNL
jgi:two-component system sensor histidine kinase RpfC